MPGVICYRHPSQQCASLGHLYRSSSHPDPRLPAISLTISPARCNPATPPPTSKTLPLSLSFLLLFSPEVVFLILAVLPGSDILRCRLVCRLLRQFIDQSAKLQYIVQANARGLQPLGSTTSARVCLARLLSREQTWATFGSIPSRRFAIEDLPRSEARRYATYGSGRMILCRGQYVVEYNSQPGQTCEYEILGLEGVTYRSIVAFRNRLGFCSNEEIYLYSIPDNEITRILSPPQQGIIESMQFHGDLIAAAFHPERRCSGVLIWDWKRGKLIETLLSVHAPTLSFAFLDDHHLVLVRTDRSARSARLEMFTLGPHGATLTSSLALPDAYPNKWYAKADIHAAGDSVHAGSEQIATNEGIISINLELRIRAPHDPTTNTTDRRLSIILVVHRRAIMSFPSSTSGATPIPWQTWSTGHTRFLAGLRLSPQSTIWGHRLIALGPELDKISLFDFCPVGVRAASRVWDPSSRALISVRAALAQRARTLVRANETGVGGGWFDGIRSCEQMPYVVSIRRGMVNVRDVWMDGECVVVLQADGLAEDSALKATWFDFSLP